MTPAAASGAPTRGAEPDGDPIDACGAELGWGLATMMRAFGQRASASVTDLPGGPRGHLVLATISRGRPPSQLALANQLGVDRTVMTYLLDDLEAAGLVERHPDPADRRARQIVITDAGSSALCEYSGRLREAEDLLLAPLSKQEATSFRRMVEKVARAAALPGDSCTVEDVSAACSAPSE